MKVKKVYDKATDWYQLNPKKDSREDYMIEILAILLKHYYKENKKLRRILNEK